MELYFLGTGAGLPSKQRNVTSVAVNLLQERGSWWLFDCGEGTQHQILHAPVKLHRVDHIFITHLHGDHVFGLPGVLSSRSFQSGTGPLTVHGPVGIRALIETALGVSGTHLTYPLKIDELSGPGRVFADDEWTVDADLLDHGVPCFGYRIAERPRLGPLLPERARAHGLTPGPAYRLLKAGQAVMGPDGSWIRPEEVTGPPIPGRVVALLGDTRPCPGVRRLARGATVLVHEATFAAEREDLARRYHHATAVQAAEAAREAGVQQLVLTHISARYGEADTAELRHQAARVFPNVLVAADHTVVPVTAPAPAPDALA
ncbi:MAG: ribonuclease Z [Alicyclobacillus sp.]|nr:ribonuclease Z [Alicyclobacillus sp.]